MSWLHGLIGPPLVLPKEAAATRAVNTSATPQPADPVASIPTLLVAGPTVSYRCWSINKDTGLLFSSADSSTWTPGVPKMARCQRSEFMSGPAPAHPNGSPAIGCSCGLYAYRDVTSIAAAEDAVETDEWIAGTLGLWGRVIEHRLGYRGQYGYPVAFWSLPIHATLPPGFPSAQRYRPPIWECIAARYGVPLLEGPP